MRRVIFAIAVILGSAPLASRAQTTRILTTDTVQSACTLDGTSAVCQVAMAGKSSASFLVTAVSSPVGFTLWAEVSQDGTNYYQTTFRDISTGERTYAITATPAVGLTKGLDVGPGIRYARVRPSARTSGTVTVQVTATDSVAGPGFLPADFAYYTSGVTTATGLTEAMAAPGSGVSYAIWGVVMSASVASTTTTDQQLRLKYGTGTNCGTGTGTLVECFNIANGGCALKFDPPIKVTANNAVCYIDAATGSKSFSITYSLMK